MITISSENLEIRLKTRVTTHHWVCDPFSFVVEIKPNQTYSIMNEFALVMRYNTYRHMDYYVVIPYLSWYDNQEGVVCETSDNREYLQQIADYNNEQIELSEELLEESMKCRIF